MADPQSNPETPSDVTGLGDRAEDLAREFMVHRPRLLGIAYRMLGTMWDAEDVVADAMVRWLAVDREQVREPQAFLTTMVTRRALDQLRSARVKREAYTGEWLPEPVGTDPSPLDPLDTVERRESVCFATLRMMEQLTPPERAVFVLHEAFDMPHAAIADALDISLNSSRQHLHRARAHIGGGDRFWTLLTLAAVIAATGVVSDSTATVIGAMIVAPLMIPIQGTMLASVLGDRRNVTRSVALVVTAAAAAIAIGIGYLISLLVPNDVVAATNSQVAARVNPNLLDLVAALATGAVASIALIRRDIADTLPGVAIAISLVPPLTVVGITLEGGEPDQAWGALLLFLTNVTAILAIGAIVMALYRVHAPMTAPAERGAAGGPPLRRHSTIVIAAMFVLVLVPLTTSSILLVQQHDTEDEVLVVSRGWADDRGWEVTDLTTREGRTVVQLAGPLPIPDAGSLRDALVADGIDVDTVEAEFVPTQRVDFSSEG